MVCIPKKVSVLGWLNQEDEGFEASLVYRVSLGCTVIGKATFTFLSAL